MREDLTIDAGFYRTTETSTEKLKGFKHIFCFNGWHRIYELYNRVADVIVKWLGIEKQDNNR
jgi:hypothetical protein